MQQDWLWSGMVVGTRGAGCGRADVGKGYTRSLNLQPRAAPILREQRRNNSAKGADAAENRLVLPSLPLVPSTTDGWVTDWEQALPHLSGGGTWALNYLFSPWWQPNLTGQSAAQRTGFLATEMSGPLKGVLKLCKLFQLLLPTHIAVPLLTTRQTSCLCLINKLLYLFRGVNLYLLWFKWHWHDIFSFFPCCWSKKRKSIGKKKSRPPHKAITLHIGPWNK